MESFFSQAFTGLSIGSILLLIALGLAIIYGSMGVINLAHGEFLMLGAYATWFMQSQLGVGLLGSLVFVFVMVAAFGWLLERTIVQFLYHRPLDTILATWGIGIMLQQGMRLLAGGELRYVELPGSLDVTLSLMGLELPLYRIFIIVLTVGLLAATWYLMKRTEFGMRLRAVTQNRAIAESYGINSKRVYSLTFAYGAGLAGVAGALVAPIKSVSPDMGTAFVVDAFMVVVMGGVGSLLGAVVSAGVLGELTAGVAYLLNDTLAKVLVFLTVIVVIRFRPQGLFPDRTRS
ncbi:urea ABC transporter permease subunit UrtB [Ectothiorhodospiraceae bacterium WFHF3C12]|nr:urea ABC transporter permease subunit UrtB [Ectothiorhodospiraceae bacterium WFHF3C12]